MFQACQLAYKKKYLENKKNPDHKGGQILLLGNTVHSFAEEYLRGVKEDLAFIDKWDVLLEKYIKKFNAESINYRDENLSEVDVDNCIVALKNFLCDNVFGRTQIVDVEKELWMSAGNGKSHQSYLGYVDLLCTGEAYDWKVTKRKIKEIDMKNRLQLALYCWKLGIRFAANFYMIVDNKCKGKEYRIKLEYHKYEFTDEDFLYVQKWAWKMGWLMDLHRASDIFMPNTQHRWKCSKNFCEFFDTCEKDKWGSAAK